MSTPTPAYKCTLGAKNSSHKRERVQPALFPLCFPPMQHYYLFKTHERLLTILNFKMETLAWPTRSCNGPPNLSRSFSAMPPLLINLWAKNLFRTGCLPSSCWSFHHGSSAAPLDLSLSYLLLLLPQRGLSRHSVLGQVSCYNANSSILLPGTYWIRSSFMELSLSISPTDSKRKEMVLTSLSATPLGPRAGFVHIRYWGEKKGTCTHTLWEATFI